jgi:4-hydroxythreonine-4-phosphate dehydrogenase
LRIAISIGDVAGIGPEIALRSIAATSPHQVLLAGPANLIELAAARFPFPRNRVTLVDTGLVEAATLFSGQASVETGAASHAAVVRGARLVMEGRADVLVTAPISKTAWTLAGHLEPGHTELIGHLTGGDPVMGFVGEEADGAEIRLALATIHEPIRALPELITVARVLATIEIFARDLRDRFGIAEPRIGVAGLNPHAGEAGKFGREDAEAIAPACALARERGIRADGPIPGDALFTPRLRRAYDALVAMYHDQGLAPFKALTSGSGVNVTLGLPIIRTSPDHGTAFDKAGREGVDPSSMAAAIRLAIRLAGTRRG